jgi:hypothetical protein
VFDNVTYIYIYYLYLLQDEGLFKLSTTPMAGEDTIATTPQAGEDIIR